MRSGMLKHLNACRSAARCIQPWSLVPSRHAASASLAEDTESVIFPQEGPGVSYGLNWALSARGIFVKDKAFYNLKSSELEKYGAVPSEHLSGFPIHYRGKFTQGTHEISKAQFNKLLKLVTSHISSTSNIFVHDGAVGSSPRCDAKVRVISDHPSAILKYLNVLWRTPTRAVSHDTCPLTVYVASSISASTGEIIGIGANNGFLAADSERASLVLCGRAFTDISATKEALAASVAPTIFARGGLPLSARLLVSGDSVILLFASEATIKNFSELQKMLVSKDAGVVLSSDGVAPQFRTYDSNAPNLLKTPAAVVFSFVDNSGVIPSLSKLSPGQAAYHFLAGYQDGKFVPAFGAPPSLTPLELAKGLLSQLSSKEIPTFFINPTVGGKHLTGQEFLKVVESALSKNLPESTLGREPDAKVGDLRAKYKDFISSKFQDLPEEFSF
ncbi:uncharacterized protein LOC18429256 [Amborella trichopoda]|uniref:phosphoenolpyruvate carboxykinase (ATP) n=1 Tax=Amborella trichopoda TaxID=13333 RepID=W1P2M1_AMBTC|nr:uncharacterized protein LOC18429256 [Amborella trichopoda]ERN01175.1 hypothetical protein AMTR_s00002p00226510 [Amborella trichopoda]|eukprot:XP_006838606.1 uncharacterized protein LOC18429256 [Amborella trichopoda]